MLRVDQKSNKPFGLFSKNTQEKRKEGREDRVICHEQHSRKVLLIHRVLQAQHFFSARVPLAFTDIGGVLASVKVKGTVKHIRKLTLDPPKPHVVGGTCQVIFLAGFW